MKCKMPVQRLVMVPGTGGVVRYVACPNRVGLLRWAMGPGCAVCETRSVG